MYSSTEPNLWSAMRCPLPALPHLAGARAAVAGAAPHHAAPPGPYPDCGPVSAVGAVPAPRGLRAACRSRSSAGRPRSWPRARHRRRAWCRPAAAEDLGGVAADVVVRPQVEGEAHRLAVPLAEQRLDVRREADRLVRPRQRSVGAPPRRFPVRRHAGAGGPPGPQPQRGTGARRAARRGVRLASRAVRDAHSTQATTAGAERRRRRAAWPRRRPCRPGRPTGPAAPR